jgi:hypothetical protein
MSLDPSDRANQPFMVMPTAASPNAAPVRRIEAGPRDGMTGDVTGVTVTGDVTGDSVTACVT